MNDQPKLGDKATCDHCGREIEYVGSWWRHTQGVWRHIAKPVRETPFGLAGAQSPPANALPKPIGE